MGNAKMNNKMNKNCTICNQGSHGHWEFGKIGKSTMPTGRLKNRREFNKYGKKTGITREIWLFVANFYLWNSISGHSMWSIISICVHWPRWKACYDWSKFMASRRLRQSVSVLRITHASIFIRVPSIFWSAVISFQSKFLTNLTMKTQSKFNTDMCYRKRNISELICIKGGCWQWF